MSSNLTHRKQLARTLAATSELTYQQALTLVTATAAQGLLPAPLDAAGMADALTILVAAAAQADPNQLSIGAFRIGGPYGSNVTNPQGKTVRPTCDVCNRKIGATESWWMVRDPERKSWANNAGVVCAQHHPEDLPLELFVPPGTLDRLDAELTPTDPDPSPDRRSPGRGKGPARTASNEQVRKAIEINVATEARINAWVDSQAGQDPHPVRWDWAPWERNGSRRDSFCDIQVTYSDGHGKLIIPADLPPTSAATAAAEADGMRVDG